MPTERGWIGKHQIELVDAEEEVEPRILHAVFHKDTGKCIGSYVLKHVAEKRRRNTVNPTSYEVVRMQEVGDETPYGIWEEGINRDGR